MGSMGAYTVQRVAALGKRVEQLTAALKRAIDTGTILQGRLNKMSRLAIRMATAEGPRRTSAQIAIREFVHELYGPSGPPAEPPDDRP